MAANSQIAHEMEDPLDLQTVIHSTPGLIHTGQPDGYLDFFNQTWLRYVGQPLEHLQGWKWTAFIHPDDVEGIVETWRASLASGEPFLYEARVLRADGQYRWMLHHKVALRDQQGKIAKWYGSSIDIEDRKRAEENLQLLSCDLQESKAKLEEAQRITHAGYWEWDLKTDRVTWSDETYRIYGLRPQEHPMDLTSVREKIHPEDWGFVSRSLEEALGGGVRFSAECRIFRPNGEARVLHSQGDVKRDASGQPYQMFGTTQDITDRKHAEDALRSSEAYLAEAQRLSHTGSFGWKPGSGEIFWSEETYRIFEYDRELKPSIDSVVQRVHPEDRPHAQQIIAHASLTGADFDHEFRLLLPDGRVKHLHAVHARAHTVKNASENNEYIGAVIDITERKRAEEKIREHEMELRQMLDFAPQQVAVFGPGNERLYANRIALDYVGLSLEEWRQTPGGLFRPGWFIHPDDRERAARAYTDGTRSGGSAYEMELRVQGKDGSYRWFLLRYNPVRNEHGQIMRWYVASTDIDERKRAEEKLQLENAALREEIDQTSMFEEIVGTSSALQTVLSHISKVAPSDSTVLITGETGTGKELVARAIHRRSRRSRRAFVSVNCAAIPRDLITSELFGHEKGAFTGAIQRRLGRFEMAEGGTIFLDEVGELSFDTQVALLRVLQEREFERVGGAQPIHADVRVIAATNRNLQAAVANGTFRQDLFYRLNVFPIEVPPLRERKDDILMLVEYFAQRYASRAGKAVRSIEKKTLDILQSYQWPGNIRELQNVIERSVILSSGEVLSVDELWLSKESSQPVPRVEAITGLNRDVEPRSEREIIEAALVQSRGRVSGPSGAAAKLGIPPSTLDHRIKALKIQKKQFKFR